MGAEKIFAVAHYLDQSVLALLVILSVVSIAIILQKYFSLKKVHADSEKVRARVKLALHSNSIDDIEDISRDISSLEGRAANYALKFMKDSGSRGLEEIFNSFILSERPELESSLGFLATIGSNAPYIGLFGTVLGIMKAFNDLASSPDAGQQTVMAGISVALIATAAGLFVAIPAVFAYNHYNKKVRGILQNVESVKELCVAYAKKKGL
ncbi:MAG TPA: MotA/TolQ/ExbB proton channel family protein [Pseudobdellovibrionaceae bacterium]|nr:MotA/TolQ/ExbB proton channel family protein [Pseudobdellovibrionaceae bacterium]